MMPLMSDLRIKQLDGLRGIAIIWVVLFHYTAQYEKIFGFSSPPLLYIPKGTVGVELFFMISGFVIFMTLEKTANFKEFILKRGVRLYPSFIIGSLLTFFLVNTIGLKDRESGFYDAIINLTFLPKILGFNYVDGAYWSLEVEVLFYLIISSSFYFISKRSSFIVLICCSLLNLSKNLLTIDDPIAQADNFLPRVIVFDVMHFFIIGIAVYKLRTKGINPWCILSILFGIFCSFFEKDSGYTTILITSIFLFGAYFQNQIFSALPLIFVGKISYAWYVIHQNIGYLIISKTEKLINVNISILLAIATTFTLAVIITKLIEEPLIFKGKELISGSDHFTKTKAAEV